MDLHINYIQIYETNANELVYSISAEGKRCELKMAVSSSLFFHVSHRLINYQQAAAGKAESCIFHIRRTGAIKAIRLIKSTAAGTMFTHENGNDATDTELTFEWNQLQTAYRSKRIGELLRAMFVLKICSYDTVVLNSMQVGSIG